MDYYLENKITYEKHKKNNKEFEEILYSDNFLADKEKIIKLKNLLNTKSIYSNYTFDLFEILYKNVEKYAEEVTDIYITLLNNMVHLQTDKGNYVFPYGFGNPDFEPINIIIALYNSGRKDLVKNLKHTFDEVNKKDFFGKDYYNIWIHPNTFQKIKND